MRKLNEHDIGPKDYTMILNWILKARGMYVQFL